MIAYVEFWRDFAAFMREYWGFVLIVGLIAGLFMWLFTSEMDDRE